MVKQNIENTVYDGDDGLDEYPNKKSKLWVGVTAMALITVGGVTAAATNAYVSNNAKHEINNAENEGLLRSRGFDENNILIDISGHTDAITISCPGTDIGSPIEDQPHVSFRYDDTAMTASWDVAPQLDNEGQVVSTYPPILFPLGSEVEVISFINNDLADACNAISSN